MREEVQIDADALDTLEAVAAAYEREKERRDERRVWCDGMPLPAPRCWRIEQGLSIWPRPLPSGEVAAELLDISSCGMLLRTRAKNVKSPVLALDDRVRIEFSESKFNDAEIVLECAVRHVVEDPADERSRITGLEITNVKVNAQRAKMWSIYRMMVAKVERERVRLIRAGI